MSIAKPRLTMSLTIKLHNLLHYTNEIDVPDKKSSNVSLSIHLEDENDNPPSFAQMVILPDQGIRVSKDELSWNPDEASPTKLTSSSDDNSDQRSSPLLYVPENVTIGAAIIRLLARDPDEGRNSEISYAILSEMGSRTFFDAKSQSSAPVKRYFVMDSRSGEISVAGAPPAESDMVLEIVARDYHGLVDNVTVRIHVFDVNDHAPVFEQSWYTFDVPEGTFKRFQLGAVQANDADHGDNANVTYEIVPDTFDKSAKFEITR